MVYSGSNRRSGSSGRSNSGNSGGRSKARSSGSEGCGNHGGKRGFSLSPGRGEARRKRKPVGEARRLAGSLFARPDISTARSGKGGRNGSVGSFSKGTKPAGSKHAKGAAKGVGTSNSAIGANDEVMANEHRLQKILAAAGYGSRRECEELITSGRVEVDGEIVTELGVRADPLTQRIRVDGEALPKMRPVYIAVNKPKGYLCTHRDQQGRRRVIDLVPDSYGRVFPVGRLDLYSEGLILLTNDGAFAERLAHPRFEVPKRYQVQVAGFVGMDLARQLQKGIHIAEGVVQADEVKVRSSHDTCSTMEITLREGKNREIRRMLARLGHKVLTLKRIAIGTVKLGTMAPGEYRPLTKEEVASLYGSGNQAD